MNIKQLECFIELAKTGNFTRSAENLYMSQSSLSRNIKSLEKELSITLFTRDKKVSKLTSPGEIILEDASRIVKNYYNMLTKLNIKHDKFEGAVTFGILDNSHFNFFPKLFSEFTMDYPKIKLSIKDYNAAEMVKAVKSLGIDCGLVSSNEIAMVDNIEKVLIGESPLYVAVHNSHPLAGKSNVSLSELAKEKFIILDPTVSYYTYKNTISDCRKLGFLPNVAHRMHSIPAAISMVECNQGIFILPSITCPETLNTVKFIPLDDIPPVYHFIVWRRDNSNPAIKVFIDKVREVVNNNSCLGTGAYKISFV